MVKNTSHAALLGTAIGASIAVAFLPGGYDALTFYLRPLFPETTAPAWVYLLTTPLSALPWPIGWQAIVFATIISAGIAAGVWGNRRWWFAVASVPMLWVVWLGQIEVFSLAGLALAGLVLQKKIPSAWMGIAYLALLTKPEVGYGILLLLLYKVWTDKDLGFQAIARALIPAGVILALTILIWPQWLFNWLRALQGLKPTWWNASIWPYGLLAWPLALVHSGRANTLQSTRMFAAASLLASPYFALYHCATCLILVDSPLAFILSWAIVILGVALSANWMQWGWLLPAAILLVDVVNVFWHRPA